MEILTGVFETTTGATRAVDHLCQLGVRADKIKLLTPDLPPAEVIARIPIDDTERPGMGLAMGALLGGLGGLVASFYFAPKAGFFPVEAGRVFITLAAAAGGALVGRRLERVATEGMPHDDLHLVEEALEHGESVVIAVTESHEQAKAIREALDAAGAEPLSAAHETWWLRIRETEKGEYESKHDQRFEDAEPIFRAGFVAALHPRFRGRSFEAAAGDLQSLYASEANEPGFRLGYERGQAHLLCTSWWLARPVPTRNGSRAAPRRWW